MPTEVILGINQFRCRVIQVTQFDAHGDNYRNDRPKGTHGDPAITSNFNARGQMYSSPRDMMAFLAANLDELPLRSSKGFVKAGPAEFR